MTINLLLWLLLIIAALLVINSWSRPTNNNSRTNNYSTYQTKELKPENKPPLHKPEQIEWTNIHLDFANHELITKWTDCGFSYSQVKEWLDIGFKPNSAAFINWLVNIKGKTNKDYTKPEWVLNRADLTNLQQEYRNYLRPDVKLFFGVKAKQVVSDIDQGLINVYDCKYQEKEITQIQFIIDCLVDEHGDSLNWGELKKHHDALRGKDVGFVVWIRDKQAVNLVENKLVITGLFSLQPA